MNLKKIGILCLGLMAGGLLQAKVRLASVFGSDMVLQRQCEAPLWGWAEPGAEVAATGSWDGSTVRTRCGADGKWMLKLKTPDAGGPYTVTVSDGEAVTLENVLIGEVWICSGQSNMEMPVGGWGRVRDYAREIESADWPRIRLFGVKRVSSLAPKGNEYTRMFGYKAIDMILHGYMEIREKGPEARIPLLDRFLVASNYAGIAFGNAGCAAVHALSYPLGATYHVAHGESNYAMFTRVMKNYMEIRQDGEIAKLNAFIADILGCDVENVYESLEDLLNILIPKKALHEYGVTEQDLVEFTDSVMTNQGRLMANNFVELDRDRVYKIYKELF